MKKLVVMVVCALAGGVGGNMLFGAQISQAEGELDKTGVATEAYDNLAVYFKGQALNDLCLGKTQVECDAIMTAAEGDLVPGTNLRVGDIVEWDGWQHLRIVGPGNAEDFVAVMYISDANGPQWYYDGPVSRITDRVPVDSQTTPMPIYVE